MSLFSDVPTPVRDWKRATDRQMPRRRYVGATEVSTKIRIGYVIDNLQRAGTQTALVNLVAGLAERGYEQRVYCLNDDANPGVVQILTASGAQVIVIGKVQLIALVGLVRLFVQFRHWRPHIVQTFLPFGDNIGRSLACMARVPSIVSSIRARDLGKQWWQFRLGRMTIRWADRVIFNSETVIPFALVEEGIKAEQVAYIPNGVRVEQHNHASATSNIRSELGLTPTTRVVGTVGRLHPQKGHRYLLTAFAEILEAMPDTVLLIVGDGPLHNQLKTQAIGLGIAGQVQFLGERSDVPNLLACMDVYVQASTYEGMPNAVMEAMAAGKPVVATRVDGIRELITDWETGWLVEPCDAKAMATRIIDVLQDVSGARRIGEAAAQRVAADFSVDRMVAAYDELYRALVADTDREGSRGGYDVLSTKPLGGSRSQLHWSPRHHDS